MPAFAQYTGEVKPKIIKEPAVQEYAPVTPEPPPPPAPPKPKPKPTPAPVEATGPSVFLADAGFDAYDIKPVILPETFFQYALDPERYQRSHLGYNGPVVDDLHVFGPTEISLDAAVIATNLLLALLFFIIVGTSNFVFNNIMESHGDDIHRWIHRIPLFKRVDGVYHSWEHWRRRRRVPVLLLILLLYAVIGAHINTSLDLIRGKNLGMLVITGLAILIGAYANDFWRWMVALRWKIPSVYKPHFMGLFLAIACVIISRTTDVSPGYLFGIPMGLFIVTKGVNRDMNVLEFIGLFGMLIFALIVWLLMPVLKPWQMLGDFDTLLYVILIEALFFLLLPLGYLPGAIVFKWKKWVWGLLFMFTVFMLFHTLFNPNSTLGTLLKNPPAINTILMLGMFAALSLGLWAWLQMRAKMHTIQPKIDNGNAEHRE